MSQPPSRTSNQVLYSSSDFISVDLAGKQYESSSSEHDVLSSQGTLTASSTFQPAKTSACMSCRKLHRRCSKTLPKCSECVTHRRKCVYMDASPSKSPRESKQSKSSTTRKCSTSTYAPIEEPQIAISEGLIKKSIKRQTLNVYMDLICMGLPFIDQQYFERLLFHENMDVAIHTYSCSIKALFLSVQSLCDQRFGRRDAAITAFNEAKSELHQVFEDYDNYFNICTYNNLSYFAASEGEDHMSQWFMAPVEYYFSKYNESNFNSNNDWGGLKFQNLDKGRGITKLFYFDNRYMWTNLTFGNFISIPFKLSTGKELPLQIKQELDLDLNENTVQSQSAILGCILQFMRQHHKTLTHSQSFLNLSRLVDISSFNKAQIESLRVLFSKTNSQEKKELYFKEMIKHANIISDLTTDDLFPYIMPTNIFGFALSAEIHLEALFHFSHLSEFDDILKYLKQDFKALTTLARKYGRVQKTYGHIYDRIQSVLLEHGLLPEELLSLISNNQLPEPTYSPNSVNTSLTTISPTNTSIDQPITGKSSPTIENTQKRKDFPSIAFLNSTLRNFKEKISNHEIQLSIPPQQPTSPASEDQILLLKSKAQAILQLFQ